MWEFLLHITPAIRPCPAPAAEDTEHPLHERGGNRLETLPTCARPSGATSAPPFGSVDSLCHSWNSWRAPFSQLVLPQQLALPLPLLVGKSHWDLDPAEFLDAPAQLGLQSPLLLAAGRAGGRAGGHSGLQAVLLDHCLVTAPPLHCLLHLLQLLQRFGEVQGIGAGWEFLGSFWPWQGVGGAGILHLWLGLCARDGLSRAGGSGTPGVRQVLPHPGALLQLLRSWEGKKRGV